MAVMPEEVKQLFTDVPNVVFATARPDGQPNCCIVGMKAVIDDETVYLSDQFFKKTLANVQENPKVSVVFWKDHAAFELYGTARYVNEGEEFEAQKAWVNAAFEKLGMPIRTKGGCFVKVEQVFSSAPGPTAGEQIA
ncbi:MAG: pyridoxamine 5'-phosphate oxidase family protein [Coriobacteriia bacterium]|nr:pyridoxamine 5'-phosphate oxidase family protein [Coriobacteriia bacterium]